MLGAVSNQISSSQVQPVPILLIHLQLMKMNSFGAAVFHSLILFTHQLDFIIQLTWIINMQWLHFQVESVNIQLDYYNFKLDSNQLWVIATIGLIIDGAQSLLKWIGRPNSTGTEIFLNCLETRRSAGDNLTLEIYRKTNKISSLTSDQLNKTELRPSPVPVISCDASRRNSYSRAWPTPATSATPTLKVAFNKSIGGGILVWHIGRYSIILLHLLSLFPSVCTL